MPAPLEQWLTKRHNKHEFEQLLPLLFLVFQEDMLELAVGDTAHSVVSHVEDRLI